MLNVSIESVIAQKVEKEEALKKAQEKKFKSGNVGFDEKHYLDIRLSKSEEKKEIVVRLMPFSEGNTSPFQKVHVHSVRVLNENGEKKWRKLMCPAKMGVSDKCPFCSIAEKARKMKFETTDEALKKEYNDTEFMNMAKDYWIVRCIDRAHEEDGVKFWRFPDTKDGNGIYEKIYALFETKRKRGVDIFDVYKGKDLIISVSKTMKGNKEILNYQIQDDETIRPLADTEEQMEKWLYDPMKIGDVYSFKDYDYLAILADGGYPVWNKDMGKWIEKKESEEIEEEFNKEPEVGDEVGENDLSSFTVNIETTTENKPIEEEDDLPF